MGQSSPDGLPLNRALALPSLSLVVPLFNERERIAESLPRLAGFISRYSAGSELLLVDDGSTDGTVQVVRALLDDGVGGDSARLLATPHRGKGAALRAGLAEAEGHYAGFCDVDLSTPLDEFQRLLTVAMIGPALVIASRDVVTTKLIVRENAGRELLGKCFNRLVRGTLTPGIYDTQCGAKVAATAVWREILPFSHQVGFAWDVEVLAIARRLSFAVWEVGVQWSHDARSHVRPWRDGLAMVGAVPGIWRDLRVVRSLADSQELVTQMAGLEDFRTA